MRAGCESVRELLPAVLLSEAGSEEVERLRRHLDSCGDCRLEADRQAALLGTLCSTEVPEPGEAYWNAFLPRLRARIAAESLPSVPPRRRQVWALAASLVILLLGAAAVLRLEPAAGVRTRMAVDLLAVRTSPGTLRQALDELLPGPGTVFRPAGNALPAQVPRAAELQRALDSLVPPEEGDFYSIADDLSPEARRWLLQTLMPDRV